MNNSKKCSKLSVKLLASALSVVTLFPAVTPCANAVNPKIGLPNPPIIEKIVYVEAYAKKLAKKGYKKISTLVKNHPKTVTLIATTLVWSVVFACYKSHRDRRESELNETAVSLISEREKSLDVLKTALELDGQRADGLSDQLKITKEELEKVKGELQRMQGNLEREKEARQIAEAALKKEKILVEVLQQQLFSGNTSVASTAQRPLGQAYDFGGTGTKMWTD